MQDKNKNAARVGSSKGEPFGFRPNRSPIVIALQCFAGVVWSCISFDRSVAAFEKIPYMRWRIYGNEPLYETLTAK
jgi:hypothetical protein